MRSERPRILVVCETITLATNLLLWLREAGYNLEIVTTFTAGKIHLRTAPDVLISELKLREYNGLHLALRARRHGIPAAVIGTPDADFEEEARQVGARYVVEDSVERGDILLLVERLLSTVITLEPDALPSAIEFDVESIGDISIGPEAPWPITPLMKRSNERAPQRPVLH